MGWINPGAAPGRDLTRSDLPYYNVSNNRAVGNGVVDDTAAIQAALDTDAPVVQLDPTKTYLISSTLLLRKYQTLMGAPRSLGAPYTSPVGGATLKFRTGSADTCIGNVPGVFGQCVNGVAFDLASADNVAVGFKSSYSNRVENCAFSGTMAIGVYLDLTYVCEVSRASFLGALVRDYSVYVGDTNAVTVYKLHTSGYGQSASVASVGCGIHSGAGHSIIDPIIQGADIGISVFSGSALTINNPYFENTLCPIRIGQPVSGQLVIGTSIFGGRYIGVNAAHPNFSKRGPIIYGAAFDYLTMFNPSFATTKVVDANSYPMVFDLGANLCTIHGARMYLSTMRDEMFRSEANANVQLTVTGSKYGTNNATEMILKKDGAYGSTSYRLGVDTSGTIVTTAYQPAIVSTAVDSFLRSAFAVPTLP